MSGRDNSNDPLAALHLPALVHEHAAKHLARIGRAENATAVKMALERAEGYGEGLEVIRALNPADLEGLYIAFDNAATARLMELEQ